MGKKQRLAGMERPYSIPKAMQSGRRNIGLYRTNDDGYDLGFGEKDSEKYSMPYETEGGCGACIIMHRDDFVACSGLDERFFMYYEDMDLSFQLCRAGKKILFCSQAVVRHFRTGSSGEWSPFFFLSGEQE